MLLAQHQDELLKAFAAIFAPTLDGTAPEEAVAAPPPSVTVLPVTVAAMVCTLTELLAEFDKATKNLYSDNQVDISMGVPVDGPQRGRLLKYLGAHVRRRLIVRIGCRVHPRVPSF